MWLEKQAIFLNHEGKKDLFHKLYGDETTIYQIVWELRKLKSCERIESEKWKKTYLNANKVNWTFI